MPEKVTYSAEAFVLGERLAFCFLRLSMRYRKHNTNGGSTIGQRTTPQAFSRSTWIDSLVKTCQNSLKTV